MMGGKHLEFVQTIYEDCEFASASSPSPSLSLSPNSCSPSTPLNSRIQAWSLATGHEPDTLIRVQGTCFHLHKGPLTERSSYLKLRLAQVSDFTLSPLLNIDAETFAAVADFCYSHNVQVTPANVAALLTAAELLGMTEAVGQDDENLRQITETYFRQVISINQDYTSMVLRSSLALLPDAETTASLVSRCMETLISANHGYDRDVTSCFDDIVELNPENFQMIAESMSRRLRNHDALYKIVYLYLKENKFGKLTEEQRTQISNCIDCTKLSPQTLIECVQNPMMPLRFIVRAMLVEQLKTRHSIISAATDAQPVSGSRGGHRSKDSISRPSMSLGEYLHRDTAFCQAAQLKTVMDCTSCRIQSLERELRAMKKLLLDRQGDEEQSINHNSVLDSRRSVSFHHVGRGGKGKIERGERGSVSSSNFRFDSRGGEESHSLGMRCSSSGASGDADTETSTRSRKINKTFRQRLMKGLKNAFRVSN
ncbi:hypothetical protein L6164_019823 [Bauhinia variegata]|uniref:Uncharacterized protein n=1 Tax=Bauhinia variegata TaxID=167791 RepID=A0ACB9MTJ7_BAUVA|nr:hypothetical protein L6164_019823 [Bauhinia variegata]